MQKLYEILNICLWCKVCLLMSACSLTANQNSFSNDELLVVDFRQALSEPTTRSSATYNPLPYLYTRAY